MDDSSLAKLDAVYQAIQVATTVQEVKDTLDTLAAAKVYAQQHKVGEEIQRNVSEYIYRAKRKLGEMLQAAKATGQITHAHDPRHKQKPVVDGNDNRSVKLSDAGISRDLSSQAQKIASIPKEDFEKGIDELKATGKTTKLRSNQKSDQPKTEKPRSHYRVEEVRAALRELETKHTQQVEAEVRRRLEGISERWKAEQEQARRIMTARKGFMPKRIFRLIVSCLHPDKFDQIISLISLGKLEEIASLKAKHSDAFRMFNQFEKFILNEEDSPTELVNFPKTAAEWAERKRQASEARKARRAAGKGIQKRS